MNAKKPTRKQSEFLRKKLKLDPSVWYVSKDSPFKIEVKNINTGEIKSFPKEV